MILDDKTSSDMLLPRQKRRTNSCCSTRCFCVSLALMFVVLCLMGGVSYTTYYFTHLVDEGSRTHGDLKTTCALNYTLSMDEGVWYYAKKDIAIGADYYFAASFATHEVKKLAGGPVTIGSMNFCFQVKKVHASGPFNCSNMFIWDPSTCALKVEMSDCYETLRHKYTDMDLVNIAYDGDNDLVKVDFISHTPGAGGVLDLVRVDDHPMVCPLANNTVHFWN